MIRIFIGDVETTGFKKPAGVVQVALAELSHEGEILKAVGSLIDPEGIEIQASAAGVHGIKMEQLLEEPTMEEFMELHNYPFAGKTIIGAHNVKYDRQFLDPHVTGEHCGYICTLLLAQEVYPQSENHKLGTLIHHLGLEFRNAHDAIEDVKMTVDLLHRIMKDTGKTLLELVAWTEELMPIRKMPFGKYKNLPLKEVPASYVNWLLNQGDFDPELEKALRNR